MTIRPYMIQQVTVLLLVMLNHWTKMFTYSARTRSPDLGAFLLLWMAAMTVPDHLQMELVELQASIDLKGQFLLSKILDFDQKLPASSFPELRSQ